MENKTERVCRVVILLLFTAGKGMRAQGTDTLPAPFPTSAYDQLRTSGAYAYSAEPLYEPANWSWLEGFSTFFAWLLVILAGLAAAGILWVIFRRVFLGVRKVKVSPAFPSEEEAGATTLSELKDRWREAKSAGDLRLAIRYLFLMALKSLSNKELITYRPEKLNSQYAAELPAGELRQTFEQLAFAFEYVWYGEWPLSLGAYERLEAGFAQYLQNVEPALTLPKI